MMGSKAKRYYCILLCILLWGCTESYAQDQCGTEVTKAVMEFWQHRSSELKVYAGKTTSSLYVPVHVHIVGDSSGNGHYIEGNAYELICELNIHFTPLNIIFFLDGPVTYINNNNYYNPSGPYANQMMNLYNVNNVCNIYLVPQLTGLCGYSFMPSSGPDHGRGGIILKNSCALPGNTDPTHEMGHYFSLLHTFQDWNTPNAEFVDGSNCSTKGDFLCDTRADYLDYRWNCPYTGTHVDAHGDLYQPDSSLYMSYSNAPCPSRFSPMQQAAILYSRSHDRFYLDSISVPAFTSLSPVNLYTPLDGEMSVPSHANALFSWSSVPGATTYNLRIKKTVATTFNNSDFNITTTDTFAYVNGFTVGQEYKWKVYPLSYSQPCAYCDSSNSQVRNFNVTYANGIQEYAKGIEDIVLYPNPVSYQPDVNIVLSLQESADVTMQLVNVIGQRVYTVKYAMRAGKNEVTVPVNNLAEGVYSVNIYSQNFHLVRKFVKIAR